MKERQLGLLGRKIGMTQVFSADGQALGVTVLELGPCKVLAIKTQERDGYSALVLGFGSCRADKLSKPEMGQLRAVGGTEAARRHVVELRMSAEDTSKYTAGQDVALADLGVAVGDLIDVTGTSKGKGFQGVMKRHNFAGFRATHGTHEYFRHGGSIGCRKWPGRVYKGRKMPGHMGARRVTTQNIEVVEIRAEENVMLVLGAIPGARNGFVTVRPAIKVKTAAAA